MLWHGIVMCTEVGGVEGQPRRRIPAPAARRTRLLRSLPEGMSQRVLVMRCREPGRGCEGPTSWIEHVE